MRTKINFRTSSTPSGQSSTCVAEVVMALARAVWGADARRQLGRLARETRETYGTTHHVSAKVEDAVVRAYAALHASAPQGAHA